ncbi:MAG: sulfite exporter TauE/SafE family protein [Campylobacterota bacterium]|nr:sulfite exporter TauE/SafE family protein [Campylobacterota bacterium]
METVDFVSIITIAFLGSFGHCVGMCGGIVLAYSSTKLSRVNSKSYEAISHLLYSLGRVLTYVVLGATFGYLGGVATFSHMANGVLWLIAGSAMLLAGLSLLGKIKFLNSIEHSFLKTTWYKKSFSKLLHSKSFMSFFLLGMLNGLLPCGFVYFFAITAASTGSAFDGALVMLIFGLSTIPALFGLGFFVGFVQNSSFKATMIKIASILVIVYGLFTIYNGYDYIVNPLRTVQECH